MKRSIIILAILCIVCVSSVKADLSDSRFVRLPGTQYHDNTGTDEPLGDPDLTHWSNTNITWYYNVNDSDESVLDALSALGEAFTEWDNVSTATLSFSEGDSISVPDTAYDSYNVIFFTESPDEFDYGWGEDRPGDTFISTIGNVILDVDIVLDSDNYIWTADDETAVEEDDHCVMIQVIATHEIGHLLGLHHYADPNSSSIMNVSSSRSPKLCNEISNDLSPEDIFGVSFTCGGRIIDDYTLVLSEFAGSFNTKLNWDITVDSNKTLTIDGSSYEVLQMKENKGITVNGTLSIGSGITITKAAESNWDGIVVNSGGTIEITEGDATISYATTGIKLNAGGTIDNGTSPNYNKVKISNCTTGLHVYNTSPYLTKYEFDNNSTSGLYAQSISSAMTLWNCTMKNNAYGVYINDADMEMYHCRLDNNNSNNSIEIFGSGGSLGLGDGSESGHNYIFPKSGYKAIEGLDFTSTISAIYNYWGTDSPTGSLFNTDGTVTYSPYLSGADTTSYYFGAKPVMTVIPQYHLARTYERDGFPNKAYDAYRNAVAELDDEVIKRRSIKKMIYLTGQIGKDYSDVLSVIDREMTEASPEYGAILDYLNTDVRFLEGDHAGAVDELTRKANSYRGTWMECEMLTFAAVIAGDYLGNKEQARTLADQAAAINPGYGALDVAYDAAGMKYHPNEHTDAFADGSGAIEKPATPPEDPLADETIEPSVSITPNPANPATTIHYTLPASARVTLSVYSVTGQIVATLVDRPMTAGRHSVVFDGSNLASGVYFYRLETPGFAKTGKMLLVK